MAALLIIVFMLVRPSLAALRGRWRHLVLDVSERAKCESLRAVYVGRSPHHCGPLGAVFGNYAAQVRKGLKGDRLAADHERCVGEYAVWLASPRREALRRLVRCHLRRRYLICHCKRAGMACHAEVLAVWANECIPCSSLTDARVP